jgi:hypothetical protein
MIPSIGEHGQTANNPFEYGQQGTEKDEPPQKSLEIGGRVEKSDCSFRGQIKTIENMLKLFR